MGNHANKRFYAAAALVTGDDDDLIRWLESMPKGERAGAIKRALRSSLFGDQPVAEVQRVIEQQPVIDELRNQQQQTIQWMQDWINHFQQQVEQLQAGWQPPTSEPLVQDVPQLSDDEAAKIAEKMKQTKW